MVIGPFPPPVQGAAEITDRLSQRLAESGGAVTCDTAPKGRLRGIFYHLSRLPRVVAAIGAILHGGRRGGAVYISAAGGGGVFYDIALAAAARCLRRPLFLHHHSFAYIDRTDWCRRLLFAIAGGSCRHICLCRRMADELRARYRGVEEIRIVSNAAHFPPAPGLPSGRPSRALVIGHLSNLSRDKGLDLVIETLDRCDGSARLVLAGNPADRDAAHLVADAKARLGSRIDLRGHLEGEAKRRFYADIDVFLFPTRYVNEAEPLVVLEALSAGVPVVAYGRGCIGHMIPEGAGRVVAADQSFAVEAEAWLRARTAAPESLVSARQSARDGARAMHEQALPALEALLAELGAAGRSRPGGL